MATGKGRRSRGVASRSLGDRSRRAAGGIHRRPLPGRVLVYSCATARRRLSAGLLAFDIRLHDDRARLSLRAAGLQIDAGGAREQGDSGELVGDHADARRSGSSASTHRASRTATCTATGSTPATSTATTASTTARRRSPSTATAPSANRTPALSRADPVLALLRVSGVLPEEHVAAPNRRRRARCLAATGITLEAQETTGPALTADGVEQPLLRVRLGPGHVSRPTCQLRPVGGLLDADHGQRPSDQHLLRPSPDTSSGRSATAASPAPASTPPAIPTAPERSARLRATNAAGAASSTPSAINVDNVTRGQPVRAGRHRVGVGHAGRDRHRLGGPQRRGGHLLLGRRRRRPDLLGRQRAGPGVGARLPPGHLLLPATTRPTPAASPRPRRPQPSTCRSGSRRRRRSRSRASPMR